MGWRNCHADIQKIAEESLAKLTGGMAVIKVHGETESEQKEILDRVDDAIRSCRAAQEEGIVAGGGVALLKAKKILDDRWSGPPTNAKQFGYRIVTDALESPIMTILKNANHKPDLLIEKIFNGECSGYDAVSGAHLEKTTMFDAGIIDPAKVIRTALLNAVSVASIMLQTNTLIIDEQKRAEQG